MQISETLLTENCPYLIPNNVGHDGKKKFKNYVSSNVLRYLQFCLITFLKVDIPDYIKDTLCSLEQVWRIMQLQYLTKHIFNIIFYFYRKSVEINIIDSYFCFGCLSDDCWRFGLKAVSTILLHWRDHIVPHVSFTETLICRKLLLCYIDMNSSY